jgi:glycosyltransferase involved in cell wall biosynthesis
MAPPAPGTLNILHVLRAPVGGLFRHVVDLARGQIARGHRVGLVADSSTGGPHAEAVLAELAPKLALGMLRIAMSRQIGPSDVIACGHVARRATDVAADVIHGHGAKGGAYARLARTTRGIRAYTPHGGSLHYDWGNPTGFVYLSAEREMLGRTDLFLFESAYSRDIFRSKIGDPGDRARVVHNGVAAAEFAPVTLDAHATDLLFVGELRMLKGVDVLIKAAGAKVRDGKRPTLTIVGDGPDRKMFESTAALVDKSAGDGVEATLFAGVKPAREAFTMGRILVVPSRAESLPYIVLEAAAAGVPLIATRVGGIPEIFGPEAGELVTPGDPAALAQAIASALKNPDAKRQAALRLQARIREHFSVDAMTDAIIAAYKQALAHKDRAPLAQRHG